MPCSGLIGENLSKESECEKLTSWYDQKLTLLDCINKFKPVEKPIDKPLRFCVTDVFKSLQSAAISLAGKMEAGTVKCGDRISIVPSNESGTIKSITNNDELPLQMCFAGDSVILNVNNVDMNNITIGNFVCDVNSQPMSVSDKLRAKIVIFNLDLPLTKGFPVNIKNI